MSEVRSHFDLLFSGAPLAVDASSALLEAMGIVRRGAARNAWLSDARGTVIAVAASCDEIVTEILREAAEQCAAAFRASSEQSHHVVAVGSTDRVAVGLRIEPPGGEASACLGLLLSDSPTSLAAVLEVREPLTLAARLAWISVGVAQRLREANTRCRHLIAEQETLRRAHSDAMGRILRERETYLRERRRYIDDLEEEVHRRSSALRVAVEKAERANRAKTEFLANMSHEIRTPMTAILGFAESLRDRDITAEESDAALAAILRNGEHLLEIINGILDLSKVESGRIEVERLPTSIAPLLESVHDLMRSRAAAKCLEFQILSEGPCPTAILTDPTRVRQILINLVGNAIKFTERGSVTVRVQCNSCLGDGLAGWLEIHVEDTGPGMTADEIERIFEPFAQADSSATRRFAGTGLGLALCKRLATALGGELVVASTPGQGSHFTLRIPAEAAPNAAAATLALDGGRSEPDAPAAGADEDDLPSIQGLRVLLAEDGPDNQRLISYILRRRGAHVDVVGDGDAATRFLISGTAGAAPVDVVLLDMQMPVKDGYTAARELRDNGFDRPIIAITAHAMDGERDRCLAAGCDEFITKPIDRSRLIRTLAAWSAATSARPTPG